ncbi:metallophosphoesterase, partial [candidate division GN15 bacterium]|nr:metallophosphoesterase [candidate division GN15 bacterium]
VMNWLGLLFLVFFVFLVADLGTVFGLVWRSHLQTIRMTALVLGLMLAGLAFMQASRPPKTTEIEVRLEGLPPEHDGLKIVAMSDTHVGAFINADWLQARVEQINALEPDLVLLLGDIFEGDYPLDDPEAIQQALRSIGAPFGVLGVTGNHELHGGQEVSVQFLEEANIEILRNEWRQVLPGLAVGGVDDGGYRESREEAVDRIRRVLDSIPADGATILLTHRPRMIEEAEAAGVELMLSGHTHGGQIWPFSYLARLANPLIAGRYEIGTMTAFVTRGAGTWGPRMRLWSPGEIVRIVLRPDL